MHNSYLNFVTTVVYYYYKPTKYKLTLILITPRILFERILIIGKNVGLITVSKSVR